MFLNKSNATSRVNLQIKIYSSISNILNCRWKSEWGNSGICLSGPYGYKLNHADGFKYAFVQVCFFNRCSDNFSPPTSYLGFSCRSQKWGHIQLLNFAPCRKIRKFGIFARRKVNSDPMTDVSQWKFQFFWACNYYQCTYLNNLT